MRVTIYQPQYFPRLHYFHRALVSDVYVSFESAQYVKSVISAGPPRRKNRSFQSDALIKAEKGEMMLTVPIKHEGRKPIRETQPQYEYNWMDKQLMALQCCYGKSPGWRAYRDEIEAIIKTRYNSLAELNRKTFLWGMARLLGSDIPVEELTLRHINDWLMRDDRVRLRRIMIDTDTGVRRPDGRQKGTQWTAGICLAIGGTEYLHGGTAANGYMDMDYYRSSGIQPVRHEWQPVEYHQQFSGDGAFIPNLSIIDLLMNAERRSLKYVLATDAIQPVRPRIRATY